MNTRLPILVAIGALAAFGSLAQAAEPDQDITIVGTKVHTIQYDTTTHLPSKVVTVTASVPADLNVLTLNSGVALLKDSVREAAEKVCVMADPSDSSTSDAAVDCIHEALRGAQPQIDALIVRARAEEQARANG
jgi:UrcA family protein